MSPIDSRAKGAQAEREVVNLLRDLTGIHVVRTRTPGAASDVGDVAGLDNVLIEVKAHANIARSISEGIPQARAAAERTRRDWPTVWVRRPGGRYVVVMEPDAWLSMWREASA